MIAMNVIFGGAGGCWCGAWLGRLNMVNECSNCVGQNVSAGLRWLPANLYWIQTCQGGVQPAERRSVFKIASNTRCATAKLCSAISEIRLRNVLWRGTLNALLPLQQERLVIREPCVSGYLDGVLTCLALASGSEAVSKPTEHDAEGKRQDG